MARPAPTMITCPNCGTRFGAHVEQIIDTRIDPTAKERLLRGRLNTVTCPNCGYQGGLSVPLIYHDAEKQLAILFMPMELNLPTVEREKLVGDMTTALMRSLPEEASKAYLLQPRQALTMQGLIDQVLEADGITRDMIEAERRKLTLIEQLAITENQAERLSLLAENEALIDPSFFELLTVVSQSLTQAGEGPRALRLLNVRSHLLETTEVGRRIKEEQEAIQEATRELQALGGQVTREKFVELLENALDNPVKLEALARLGYQILDYTTFQLVTTRIDSEADPERRQKLVGLRDKLLEVGAEYERQSQAVLQQAADTLRALLSAPDLSAAIQANLNRIDDVFLQVLQANLEEARRSGNVEVSTRLKEIRDEILGMIQSSAPPEVQFINDLVSLESEADALQLLKERQAKVTDELLDLMHSLSEQLREAGNTPVAARIDKLLREAAKLRA